MKLSSSYRTLSLALMAAALAACVETNPKEPSAVPTPKVTAPADPTLLHRYSFTSDAKDSVGKIDGVLKNSAKIAGGKLVLDGDAKPSSDGTIPYLEFSGPILPKSGNASIAMWFTCSEKAAITDRAPRLLDIGDISGTVGSGAVGDAFLYFTPHFGATENARAKISASTSAAGTALDTTPRLDDGKPHLVVITLDATTMHMFVDGKEPTAAVSIGGNNLAAVKQTHSWIGRSGFDADNGVNGSVDEVRAYSRTLTLADVAALQAAGPDKLP